MSMLTGCFSKGWHHVTIPDNSIEVDYMIRWWNTSGTRASIARLCCLQEHVASPRWACLPFCLGFMQIWPSSQLAAALDWDWGEQRAGDSAEDGAGRRTLSFPWLSPPPLPRVPPCQNDSDNMRYRLWRSTAKYLIWTIMPHHNCGAQITNSLLLASVHFAVSTNCTEELITTLMEGIPNGWCAVSCLGKSSLMRNKLRGKMLLFFLSRQMVRRTWQVCFTSFFFPFLTWFQKFLAKRKQFLSREITEEESQWCLPFSLWYNCPHLG